MIKTFKKLLLISIISIIIPSSLFAAALDDGLKAFKDKDYKSAVSNFKQAAKNGNSAAQDILGNIYYNGDMGVKKDLKQAAKYWKQAADQGHSASQGNLGFMYLSGTGVEKNIELAEKYLKESSKAGNLLAMTNLGILYLKTGNNFEGIFRVIMAAKAQNPTAKTVLLSMGITIVPPLPGESMASREVVDVMVPKLVAMAQKEAGDSCDGKIAKVIDSRILGKPEKIRINEKTYYKMKEEWLIDVCNKQIPITTEFHTEIKSRNEHLDAEGNPINLDKELFGEDYSH